MLTHADYHAARPLPSGVALAALFNPPAAMDSPSARKVSPLGYEPPIRAYEPSLAGVEINKAKMHAIRIATYRPAMLGKGWKNVAWISEYTGISPDSVRQRMTKLAEDGLIESQKKCDGTVQYRWIGS